MCCRRCSVGCMWHWVKLKNKVGGGGGGDLLEWPCRKTTFLPPSFSFPPPSPKTRFSEYNHEMKAVSREEQAVLKQDSSPQALCRRSRGESEPFITESEKWGVWATSLCCCFILIQMQVGPALCSSNNSGLMLLQKGKLGGESL